MFFYGDFAVISPPSLLQMLCQEQRSVLISAWRGTSEAHIQLHEGFVVGAHCGDLTGEEAFYHVVVWSSGQFRLTPAPDAPADPEFVAYWEELVLEAARRRDELELHIEPLFTPSWQQAGMILSECPALTGVALVGYDGRMLVSIGFHRALTNELSTIAGCLAAVGNLLRSTSGLDDEPHISFYNHRNHKLLLADRRDGVLILAVLAPQANIRDAMTQLAAQVSVVD